MSTSELPKSRELDQKPDQVLDGAQPPAISASRQMAVAAILGAGCLWLVSYGLFNISPLAPSILGATLLYGLAGILCVYAMRRTYPHKMAGLCNFATLIRLVVVGIFWVAIFEKNPPNMALLVLAIFSLCLDGVDGWLARRQGLSSEFGARFDVEVDAAFALTLALYAAFTNITGPYVILLGIPYYMFKLASIPMPWLTSPLPPRQSRKWICVIQIATLILLLLPFAHGIALNLLVVLVALALVWSFGKDILWLYRERA